MASVTRGDFTVWVALPDGEVVPAADMVISCVANGRHQASGFRYRAAYLSRPDAFSLNPVFAPLQAGELEWITRELPALVDEVMPGQWEQAVLRQLWREQGVQRNIRNPVDVLNAPRHAFRVGAVEILPLETQPPPLSGPLLLEDLAGLLAEAAALEFPDTPDTRALARFQQGSSVGGARPKALVRGEDRHWLAKFNRRGDEFNYVRVEHACLTLARRAGIRAPYSEIRTFGDRDVLLVERFDVTPAGGRRHLVSANALLKDRESQADNLQATYDRDLGGLIRHFSTAVSTDLKQLYALMLVNDAIHNRDDHLRNFSFVAEAGCFSLAPAYDLVPTAAAGAWATTSFGLLPSTPAFDSDEARRAGRAFQLSKSESREIHDRVTEAAATFPALLAEAGVTATEIRLLQRMVPALRHNAPKT